VRSGVDLKTLGPAAAVLAIVVIPLVVWSASSGSNAKADPDLSVSYDPSRGGDPLLTVTIAKELNVPRTAKNGHSVKLECVDGEGNVIAQTEQPFPFVADEAGYGAHAHQLVPADKIRLVERCRLLGTRMQLEAKPQT
jgi:hypothetical protein